MPYKPKFPKTTASVSMTPEAWAILHQHSKQAGLSKSEYLENLVRRGDQLLYEEVRKSLIDSYKASKLRLIEIKAEIGELEAEINKIKDLLTLIGVSPNQIPE